MACEKPVITTPLPAIKESVGDGVLYATTPVEYKERIELLYNDKDLGQKMGREGRKYVVENRDWELLIKQMERTLIEVI